MLWALSAVIVLLASHVLLGWVRQAQAVASERRHWFAVSMAAAAFGTALSAAVALSLSGESLAFPVGYQRLSAIGIWLGSVALLLPAAALLAFWPSLLASLAAGLLAGAVATVVEAGWVTAAGFRPGIIWNRELLLASWLACSTGFSAAFALGFPRAERTQHYRYSWRIAAAALMALSFVASLALVIMGAGLPTQVGSIYRHELSGTTVSLLGGGILPLMLVMMIVDLEVRRRQRRRVRRKKRRDAEASRFATFEMPGDMGTRAQPATHPTYLRRGRPAPNVRGLGMPLAAAGTGAAAEHWVDSGVVATEADRGIGMEATWTEAQADVLRAPQQVVHTTPASVSEDALLREWAQAQAQEVTPEAAQETALEAVPVSALAAAAAGLATPPATTPAAGQVGAMVRASLADTATPEIPPTAGLSDTFDAAGATAPLHGDAAAAAATEADRRLRPPAPPQSSTPSTQGR
jgi:hypothetical protein